MEVRNVATLACIALNRSLTHVGVTHSRYQPYERQTTYEVARTTTQNQLTVASDVPVETYTRRHSQTCVGHLVGRVVCRVALVSIGFGCVVVDFSVGCTILQIVVSLVEVATQRRIVGHLETQTSGQLEVLVQVQLILQIEGILLVVHLRLELLQVGCIGVHYTESRSLVATHEVLHRIEYVITVTALHETVDSVLVLVLQTEDETVDTEIPVQLVGDDVRCNLASVTCGEGVGTERHVASAVLQNIDSREYTALVFTRLVLIGVGVTQGVGQTTVKPTRVQLSSHRGEVTQGVVTAALEVHSVVRCTTLTCRDAISTRVDSRSVERRYRRRRRRRVLRVGSRETEVQVVIFVDVPIQTSQNLVTRGLNRVVCITSRIVVVGVDQEVAHGLQIGYRRTLHTIRTKSVAILTRDRAWAGCHVIFVLTIDEEEELVLDDRTTEANTIGVGVCILDVEGIVTGLVATQGAVLEEGVGRSAELVVTRTGHSVDGTTRKTTLTNIVGGYGHRNLLQCIERDRRTTGRQVLTDTEGVVERSTIDRHIRLTVVTTTDSKTVGGRRRLRRHTHDVVHASRDGRCSGNTVARYAGDGTCTLGVHRAVLSVDSHNHRVEVDRLLVEVGIADVRLTQRTLDTCLLNGLITNHRKDDGVGTTRTDVVDSVVTLGIYRYTVLRSRRNVGCHYCCANQRSMCPIGHITTDARCSHLRRNGAEHEQRKKQKGKFFHTVIIGLIKKFSVKSP